MSNNKRRSFGLILSFVCATAVGGCALFTKDNANSALDAIQLGCIFGSELVEEKALADACNIANDLIPVIRKIVAQREAAKKSGVYWNADAGSDASVDQVK